jgi:hypothetical protein
MPSRILVFLCAQAIVAVPAILTRERSARVILVGVLVALSFGFGIVMPGSGMRAAIGQIRAVELTRPITPELLRNILLGVLYRTVAMYLALCFWLAILAVVPMRGRRQPTQAEAEAATAPRGPRAV